MPHSNSAEAVRAIAAREAAVPFAEPRRPAPLRVMAAMAAVAVVLVVASEVASRWWMPVMPPAGDVQQQQLVMTEGRLYRFREGLTAYGFHINSMGFRGGEFPPRDPEVLRVVAIGDSTVFGYGSDDDATWPHLAGLRLAELSGTRAEVLNLGVIAESSTGSLQYLRQYGDALDPDVVVASLGAYNDYQIYHSDPHLDDRTAIQRRHFARELAAAQSPLQVFWGYRLWRRSYWERRANNDFALTNEWIEQGKFAEDAVDIMRRVPLDQFEENLREVCAWGAERGVPVVFVVMRLSPEDERTYGIARRYREVTRQVAAECGARVVAGDEILTGLMEQHGAAAVWWDYVHLHRFGNEVMANEIAAAVMDALARSAEGGADQ